MEKTLAIPVGNIMTKKVISVKENEPLKHLFQLMNKHDILGVPVVNDEGQVVGIVTESDLMKHFTTLEVPRGVNLLGSMVFLDDLSEFNRSLKEHCAETIGELMTKPVITLPENATLLDAINQISGAQISRLPIVDDTNKLVGIITRSDILHQLVKIRQP